MGSWLYAHKRKTFGKGLIDHPVIRWKFAEMARQVDCLHCMLEYIAYQGVHMDFQEAQLRLAEPQPCSRCKRPRHSNTVPVRLPKSLVGPATYVEAKAKRLSEFTVKFVLLPFQAVLRKLCSTWASARA